jgi:hypothetical protein
MALAVEWGTCLLEVVVCYCNVDIAADENLTEEEMNI